MNFEKDCPKDCPRNLSIADMESQNQSAPDSSPPIEPGEAYLRLLSTIERWLSVYVHSLVASSSAAQDIIQDVRITMWKHFSSFQPGSNARAWAQRIATNHVLNYRRAFKKRSAISLDDAFVEAVAQEIDQRSDALDLQSEVLLHCLQKLPDAHRKIILWRYYEDCEVEEIASRTQRTIDAVYRGLSRIREALQECVRRHRLSIPS